MHDVFVHTSDGKLVNKHQIPGTVVRRKQNLPFNVHPHFPVGETKVIGQPCGNLNPQQDPDREFCHVPVEADPYRGIARAYCFHPYADTLEVVE